MNYNLRLVSAASVMGNGPEAEFPKELCECSVRMAVEDALTKQDKAEGYILACQAKIRGDVRIDS
jgi:hypothetical protein